MQLVLGVVPSVVILLLSLRLGWAKVDLTHTVTVGDQKEWKKLLKTRTNVLALFANGQKHLSDFLPVYEHVAKKIKGKGTLAYVDCETKDGKKLCKNLKIRPNPFEIKHYKDGTFHKDYDRLLQEKSLGAFMENPTADAPWSEDPSANDVRHVEGPNDFERLMKKEKKPVLEMFYTPWCGHCKKMKPEFAEAVTELRGRAVLAGMDVDTPDSYAVRQWFNISGFPTVIYFEDGQKKFDYGGPRTKAGIIEWMRNPRTAEEMAPKEEEEPWSEVGGWGRGMDG